MLDRHTFSPKFLFVALFLNRFSPMNCLLINYFYFGIKRVVIFLKLLNICEITQQRKIKDKTNAFSVAKLLLNQEHILDVDGK